MLMIVVLSGPGGASLTSDTSPGQDEVGEVMHRAIVVEAHRVHSTDPTEREDVEWALGRFEAAGLALPAVDIYLHKSLDDCMGKLGIRTRPDGADRVDVCSSARRRNVLLHELAHVWVAANVSQELRTAFQDLRGLTTWGEKSVTWHERGTEQAAEIISWAIGNEQNPLSMIKDDTKAAEVAYQLLTNREFPQSS